MKDLKNIIVDLWELFFPLLIRIFLTSIILTVIINSAFKNSIWSLAILTLQNFVDSSRIFLASLKLDSFLGVYFLIVLILICYTFNSILNFINSIFRVSIYWRGYVNVAPTSFSKILKYFPEVTDVRNLESEIQKILFDAKKDNKQNLADGEKSFLEKLTKFNKYTDILTFEFMFMVIFSILCWKYVVGLKVILIISFLVLSIFFNLSRTALEVRLYYSQVLYKIELILENPILSDEQARELEIQLTRHLSTRWWGISLRIIGDVRETIRNFGSLEIR